MTTSARLEALREGLSRDLRDDVLPYWTQRVLDPEKGFHGLVSETGQADPEAPMGGVLAARLLWTFSAVSRRGQNPQARAAAEHFYRLLLRRFWDHDHGGIYWMLDHAGRPVSTRKQTYALAFALYALAEYSLATGDAEARERAIEVFRTIEARTADPVLGGYFEARARDWSPLADVRLSERDLNAPKSMNTHLHVMEGYANLVRTWDSPAARRRLGDLVRIHLDTIVDAANGHLILFFDERFVPLTKTLSYGHDIEASWLIVEAAELTRDASLAEKARANAVRMAQVTLEEGCDPEHGGVYAERREDGTLDDEKHWWMQAEAIVGFLNAYEISREERFLAAAERTWAFVERCVIDREHGEWRRQVQADGSRIPGLAKVEPWKCPYHNSRAALETDTRVTRLLQADPRRPDADASRDQPAPR